MGGGNPEAPHRQTSKANEQLSSIIFADLFTQWAADCSWLCRWVPQFLRGQLIKAAFHVQPAKLLVGKIQNGRPVFRRQPVGPGR